MRSGESSTLVLVFFLVMAILAAAGWIAMRDSGSVETHSGEAGQSGLLRAFGLGPVARVQVGHPAEPTASPAGPAAAPPASPAAAQATVEAPAVGTAAPAPEPAPAPADQPLQAGDRARITGTGDTGVVLRSAPREDAREPRGLLEGTVVTVLNLAGDAWVQVKTETGQPGWVPPQYVERLP
jgi:hypothetical protein